MSPELVTWKAWMLDPYTLAFIAGWVWFFAWETAALVSDNYLGTWTAHFRPVFTEVSLTWFLGQAALAWLWIHIFYPAFERKIFEVIT